MSFVLKGLASLLPKPWEIAETPAGLSIVTNDRRQHPIVVDFTQFAGTSRLKNIGSDPLIKALGIAKKPCSLLIDATAGLGIDSALLLALTERLVLIESHPVLIALLEDGLQRLALACPELRQKITLIPGDASTIFSSFVDLAPIVYLDPMFPPVNTHAKPSKTMQFLQALIPHSQEGLPLLFSAAEKVARRIVIKQPRSAPLVLPPPTFSHEYQACRFDGYVISAP